MGFSIYVYYMANARPCLYICEKGSASELMSIYEFLPPRFSKDYIYIFIDIYIENLTS